MPAEFRSHDDYGPKINSLLGFAERNPEVEEVLGALSLLLNGGGVAHGAQHLVRIEWGVADLHQAKGSCHEQETSRAQRASNLVP